MKTLTEFFGVQIKNVVEKIQELTSAGQSQEQISGAISEQFKIEGEKLKHLLHAAELVKEKLEGLKRVVAIQLNENEKPPKDAQEKEGFYYIVEFFPKPLKPKKRKKPLRGDRRKGRKGRGRRKGGRQRGTRPWQRNKPGDQQQQQQPAAEVSQPAPQAADTQQASAATAATASEGSAGDSAVQ